jgi:hypothetical protein
VGHYVQVSWQRGRVKVAVDDIDSRADHPRQLVDTKAPAQRAEHVLAEQCAEPLGRAALTRERISTDTRVSG